MSMDVNGLDTTVRMARIDGLMLIGRIKDAPMKVKETIEDVRVVMINQAGQIALGQMIGLPQELALPANALVFTPGDENLVKAYLQAITGIELAKAMPKNVVQMVQN